jgi:hypothetical protein
MSCLSLDLMGIGMFRGKAVCYLLILHAHTFVSYIVQGPHKLLLYIYVGMNKIVLKLSQRILFTFMYLGIYRVGQK